MTLDDLIPHRPCRRPNPQPTDEAAWWVRKAGTDHYDEHLGRLREWVTELIERRIADVDGAS